MDNPIHFSNHFALHQTSKHYICIVNKFVKTSVLIGFILLYIFAISIDTNVSANASFLTKNQESATGYFKDQPSHLFSHTNQSFENVLNFTSTNFSESKRPFKAFSSFVQVTDNILESKFVQYTLADVSFPLKFTKKDIIYPFHFFY